METIKITDRDLDKHVHLDLQVVELLFLNHLLADVVDGHLSPIHFDEKHRQIFIHFFHLLDSKIHEALEND